MERRSREEVSKPVEGVEGSIHCQALYTVSTLYTVSARAPAGRMQRLWAADVQRRAPRQPTAAARSPPLLILLLLAGGARPRPASTSGIANKPSSAVICWSPCAHRRCHPTGRGAYGP